MPALGPGKITPFQVLTGNPTIGANATKPASADRSGAKGTVAVVRPKLRLNVRLALVEGGKVDVPS